MLTRIQHKSIWTGFCCKRYTLKRSYKWPLFKVICFQTKALIKLKGVLLKYVHFNTLKFIGVLEQFSFISRF